MAWVVKETWVSSTGELRNTVVVQIPSKAWETYRKAKARAVERPSIRAIEIKDKRGIVRGKWENPLAPPAYSCMVSK